MNDWAAKFGNVEEMAAQAMASLEQEKGRLAELGKAWSEQTTVQAKDKSLSMTLDGTGELLDLTFHGTKYKTMPPAKLAHLIVDTLRRGRTENMERINAAMGPSDMPVMDLSDVMSGKTNPVDMITSLLSPMLDGLDELLPTPEKDSKDKGAKQNG